mmetsp:Transcript_66816/g.134177  ORF Transcript_66816/g.134177 Transcript_66816/m.134177 type:complete len:157 (-) Transcript_66816:141-611(-)
MQEAWDMLMFDCDGLKTMTVGEVDCSRDGKDLCDQFGVKGYPTLMYGDPSDLKVYRGQRSYDSFMNFTAQNLVAECSPHSNFYNICSAKQRALLSKYGKMSIEELDAAIAEATSAMEVDVPIMHQVIEYLEDMGLDGPSGAEEPEAPRGEDPKDEL